MKFEEKVTLFLDAKEITTEVKRFLERYSIYITKSNKNEGIISFYLTGRYIGLDFILELEDVLNRRITLCSRYIGSAETIKSLGLD